MSTSWTDTGLTVKDGDELYIHIPAKPVIFGYSVGGVAGPLHCLPEGVYLPDYPYSHGYQTALVATFNDLPFSFTLTGNTGKGIRPHCLGFALSANAPSLPYAGAFCPGRHRKYTPDEVRDLADGDGPWKLWAIQNDTVGGFSNNNGYWDVLAIVPEGLGHVNYSDWIFKWERAFDDEDRRRGGCCAETGFWAPSHSLVDTSSGRIIDYFAPEEA